MLQMQEHVEAETDMHNDTGFVRHAACEPPVSFCSYRYRAFHKLKMEM